MRGACEKSKALNLLLRPEERHEEIMGFFEHPGLPFDNNRAGRDLRMMKVREKISGTFRREEPAAAFCDLSAVLSSAVKQGRDLVDTIVGRLRTHRHLGESLARGSLRLNRFERLKNSKTGFEILIAQVRQSSSIQAISSATDRSRMSMTRRPETAAMYPNASR